MRPLRIKTVSRPAGKPLASAPQTWLQKFREEAVAWVSLFGLLATGLFGWIKYVDQQREAAAARLSQEKTVEDNRFTQAERDNRTRLIEAQKPFFDLRFQTYLRTNSLVGRMLVTYPKDPAFRKMVDDFDTLFWTELALVEDTDVARAMVDLGDKLHPKNGGPPGEFKSEAISLAHAFRDSIRKGWEQGVSK